MTRPSASSARLSSVLLVLGSCLSVQLGSALAAQLFPSVGTWGTTLLRIGLAAAVLLVVVRPRIAGLTRQQWGAIIVFGLVLGAMNGAFYAAIDRIPLGTAVAIEFLGPLTVSALLSTRRSDLLWVAAALAGVSLFGIEGLTSAEGIDLLGVGFALIAAVFWGLYVLSSERVGRLVAGQDGLALALVIGTLALLPFGAPGAMEAVMEPRLLLLALGTAVLATVLPYTCELAALRRLPRNVFGILLSLEPVIALLVGVLLLSQGMTPLRVVAALLVVGASVGVTLTARSAPADEPAPADEEPGWDMPVPARATITGEMPLLSSEDFRAAEAAEAERAEHAEQAGRSERTERATAPSAGDAGRSAR